MSENENKDTSEPKKVLSLSGRGKLELKRGPEQGQVRQSFSHGRSKTVAVEVKRKRVADAPAGAKEALPEAAAPAAPAPTPEIAAAAPAAAAPKRTAAPRQLTDEERAARERALRTAATEEVKRPARAPRAAAKDDEEVAAAPAAPAPAPEPARPLTAEERRQRELAELRAIEDEEKNKAAAAEKARQEDQAKKREAEKKTEADRKKVADRAGDAAAAKVAALGGRAPTAEEEDEERKARARRGLTPSRGAPARPGVRRDAGRNRTPGKLTVTQAINSGDGDAFRGRSLAAMRRHAQKGRRDQHQQDDSQKIARDVIIPEAITVQELAQRMAERGSDVIKALMRMGVMATITQSVDADTAELLVTEFGHRARRVSESDVLIGMTGEEDAVETLISRPPVVTVMGHVDHGKTSLLDAIRKADVVSGEAGGITQHIGAYQVQLGTGQKITFIDTPGHAAFTEMRARGANVTDVVVLVVAANDGVMPQTVEAIAHAKAAGVPIIVAINKIDLPDANPQRVKTELLSHELVVEDMGGDVLTVEVSATKRTGLEKLEEAILLQAEVLDLKSNPDRSAVGTVVEAKLDRGRGSVATVLVEKGTLRVGDIFVAGAEWGRVRALVNDRGQNVTEAGPAMPVEVVGLNGTPNAGDDLVVTEDEARAREIAEYRARKKREASSAIAARGSVEQMFSQIQAGEKKEMAVVIKGDVHGSVEAITGALTKLAADSTEVALRVLHSGVGAINESDVTLARASGGVLIGFNVRANAQARDLAKRDAVEIRYYSVIYDIIDDVRGVLSGLLAPQLRETFLGNAQIREVFNITRVGKVAGCMVTEGLVKRGAKVRLLRDNVVIHEGSLKTLKRFKDEVREVREGFECGMAFENYDDVKAGDVIEAFEVESVARTL
jgi:translation initiation factor IF-2